MFLVGIYQVSEGYVTMDGGTDNYVIFFKKINSVQS